MRVKIRYYVVKKGKGYWQPTKQMRCLGFSSVPCGRDGPDAWQLAECWNDRWAAVKFRSAPSPAMAGAQNLSLEAGEEITIYPPRSIGASFRDYRRTGEWKRKAARTREDWWRGWKRIKPVFGDLDPRSVRFADLSAWRAVIEETVSLREAHRALKIWRALWKISAIQGYCIKDADPSLGVTNSAAQGRSEIWLEREAVRLYKRAVRNGYHGLAAVIAVAWDTQLSPVDVRQLKASQIAQDSHGGLVFTERKKSDVPVCGALSARAVAALSAYLNQMPTSDDDPDTAIFLNRSGAPYSKDTLGDDFRAVRTLEFGAKERRTLADFRRSGAIEAIVGGSGAEHLSHAMGNTLSASNALFKIYAPVNLASIREVQVARRLGRPKLAALDKLEKVGTMAVRKLERPRKQEINGAKK
ncbi:hypothetical protein [Xanthobacter wiegelii]|uniref:hypothetical protein n=1 Tax=Xanthobacter wiegelii TaxID=3119913 RepID=UPI003726B53D